MALPKRAVILLLVVTGLLRQTYAEEHRVNWTIEGVTAYVENPLAVRFGDTVKILCSKSVYSNVIYVESYSQYEKCNTSVGDGHDSRRIGECVGTLSVDHFSQQIQRLSGDLNDSKVIDYRAGEHYYFFSASTGTLLSTRNDRDGGQCLEGLKMVVSVLPREEATSTATVTPTVISPPKPTLVEPKNPEGSQSYNSRSIALIAGPAIGAVLILVLILVLISSFILLFLAKRSGQVKASHNGAEEESVTMIKNTKSGGGIQTDGGGGNDSEVRYPETPKEKPVGESSTPLPTTTTATTGQEAPLIEESRRQRPNGRKPPTHPARGGSRNDTSSHAKRGKPTGSRGRPAPRNRPSTTDQNSNQATDQRATRTGSLSPNRTAPPPPRSNGNQGTSRERPPAPNKSKLPPPPPPSKGKGPPPNTKREPQGSPLSTKKPSSPTNGSQQGTHKGSSKSQVPGHSTTRTGTATIGNFPRLY